MASTAGVTFSCGAEVITVPASRTTVAPRCWATVETAGRTRSPIYAGRNCRCAGAARATRRSRIGALLQVLEVVDAGAERGVGLGAVQRADQRLERRPFRLDLGLQRLDPLLERGDLPLERVAGGHALGAGPENLVEIDDGDDRGGSCCARSATGAATASAATAELDDDFFLIRMRSLR